MFSRTYHNGGVSEVRAVQFNGGWPVEATAESKIDPTTVAGGVGTDQGFIAGLDLLPPNADGSKKFYMAAVSPWFFTHFGAPLNKNVRPPSSCPLSANRP